MPEMLTATYRIVTPMFIGDAHQEATEITAASVKGALRFWWRALNWGRFRNQAGASDESALKALHTAEAELFGAAADDKHPGRGQSRFLLSIPKKRWQFMTETWPVVSTGSGYLGQGLWASGKLEKNNYQPPRSALQEGQNFEVRIVFKPMPAEKLENVSAALKDVLTLWGLAGGLGSRSRRGFGSVQLLRLGDTPLRMESMDAWFAAFTSILSRYPVTKTYPPFSAFSTRTRLGYLANGKAARQAHDKLGKRFKEFRGDPMGGNTKGVFGMPLPGGSKAMANARRGSPLLFHIVQLGEQDFVPVAISLPTEPFHPDDLLNRVDWSLIDEFFGNIRAFQGAAA